MGTTYRRTILALCVIITTCWCFGQVESAAQTPDPRGDTINSMDGDTTYRVQAGAYFSTRRAKKLKRKIEKDPLFEGLIVAIEFSAKSGVYRVKVGSYKVSDEAEALRNQLLGAGYEEATVVEDQFLAGPRSQGEESKIADPPMTSTAAVSETVRIEEESGSEPPPVPLETGSNLDEPSSEAAQTSPPAPERPADPVPVQTGDETIAGEKPVLGQATIAAPRGDYLIGAEDLLEVSVFELDGLNKTVRVTEEGMISLPLLGEIRAEGLTQKGLSNRISDLLEEKYINDPQVSVFIREYRSHSVSVIGAVRKPGSYKLLGTRTLIHMISEAGGLTENAGPELYIIRTGADGRSQRITVNTSELMVEGRPEVNHSVIAGDVINIPFDLEMAVYIYGAVREPGELQIRKSESITLLQAITKAGGITERAAEERIRIKRRNPIGDETLIKVNLKQVLKGKMEDVPLMDKDVVVVPETIF